MHHPSSKCTFPGRTWRRLPLTLLFLCAGALWAAPVNGVFTYHQPDGTTLQVRVVGDEFYAEETTLDGRRIIQDPVTKFWCYARLSADGNDLESTGIVARNEDYTREGRTTLAVGVPGVIKTPKAYRERIDRENRARLGRDRKGRFLNPDSDPSISFAKVPEAQYVVGGTTQGTKKGLTLLVKFPDRLGDATITREQVNNYCNQTSTHYTEFGNNGSVAEYFYEVSNGKLIYTNHVANYYTAKNNRSYYTDETASGRARELVIEALNALESSGFDFRTCDMDGDGYVDALNCFYAGAIVNAWAKGLWPHAGGISWQSSRTGIRVRSYQITNMGSSLTLGTFCHENGHMLCKFPDVYDYNGDSNGGAGRFCLMNGGGHGTNPTPPNGYLRFKAGWGSAETISSSASFYRNLVATNGRMYLNQFLVYYNPSNSKEYFLIENRNKDGRDAGIPCGGIAVWHVDEEGNHNYQNYTHQTSHNNYEVALIQADNQRHFERNINGGDVNDLFYAGNTASGYKNEFSDTSDTGPYDNNSHWWSGAASKLRLSEFSAPGNTMSLRIQAGPGRVDVSIKPTSVRLPAGSKQQFSATVEGASNTAVTWSCTGGTITSTGLYTAPATAGTYKVTAASQAEPSRTATATVTVTGVEGPSGFTWCAYEGQSYTLPGLCDVAYGSNGKFAYKYGVSGTIAFNNTNFGDPIPGVFKSGFYRVCTTPPGYTKCANEGQSYTLPGVCDVAYGANGKFFYKYRVIGSITFNNATFGDPIPGVYKAGFYKQLPVVAQLYQHINYAGYVINLPEGTYTLSQLKALGMKDNDISSLKVSPGYRVELYSDDNFRGTKLIKTSNDATLVDDRYNDVLTSVKVIKQ